MTEVETSYDKILREHQELRGLIKSLRSFLVQKRPAIGEEGSHSWAASLASRLVTLHDKVFVHFREEEREGLMADIEKNHPRAIPQVEELKREHEEILGDFHAVLETAMKCSEWKDSEEIRPRRDTIALLDKLQRHEATETDFIQRISAEDLGRGA